METPPERNCLSLYPLGCFPILFPLLQLMGCSFFSRDSFTFVKKIVEKIRAERDGDSHRVCTEHTRTLTTHTSTPIPKFPLITRLHKRKMDDDYLSFVFFFLSGIRFPSAYDRCSEERRYLRSDITHTVHRTGAESPFSRSPS